MTTDSRSISEIVNNPPDEDEDDTELEGAQVTPEPTAQMPIPHIVGEALRSAPDVLTAREVAKIPPHYSVAELVDKPIVIAWKVAQKAFLPSDTGPSMQRDGYFVTGAFTDTQQTFTVWIGQSALKRDLESLLLPFRTIIRKTGRKYNFR